MAITELGSSFRLLGESAGGDSAAITFPSAVAIGDLIVVAGVTWWSTNTGTPAVSDNLSTPTSYTVGGAVGNSANYQQFVGYGIAKAAGTPTVTVNPPGTQAFIMFGADAWSLVHPVPLDANPGGTGALGANPSTSITTVDTGALIVATMDYGAGDGAAITPGAGYTQIAERETNGSKIQGSTMFRLATTPGSYTVNWTASGSPNAIYRTSFKPAPYYPPKPDLALQAVHRAGSY
jgi:hypothetical protein